MKTNFLGTGVAMITPFKENKNVDYVALKNIINHLIDGKVEYILVMGTTAESATLSFEEKNKILEFAKKEINGRVQIMYGLGGNNTADVIKNIEIDDAFQKLKAIITAEKCRINYMESAISSILEGFNDYTT